MQPRGTAHVLNCCIDYESQVSSTTSRTTSDARWDCAISLLSFTATSVLFQHLNYALTQWGRILVQNQIAWSCPKLSREGHAKSKKQHLNKNVAVNREYLKKKTRIDCTNFLSFLGPMSSESYRDGSTHVWRGISSSTSSNAVVLCVIYNEDRTIYPLSRTPQTLFFAGASSFHHEEPTRL